MISDCCLTLKGSHKLLVILASMMQPDAPSSRMHLNARAKLFWAWRPSYFPPGVEHVARQPATARASRGLSETGTPLGEVQIF